MTTKASTLQDLLRKRQALNFISREHEIDVFRENFKHSVGDKGRKFIFNIYGQGGVGKTALILQLMQIAQQLNTTTAYLKEDLQNVPHGMGIIAEQLRMQGHSLEYFDERFRVYRQKLQELEADPSSPKGLAELAGQSIARATLQLSKLTPAAPLIDLINTDAAATQAGEWAKYVVNRLTNKDEVHLVLKPVEVLTPLWLKDLNSIAERKSIAIFFDTYEITGKLLDAWLQDILDGKYGPASSQLTLIIGGRSELDRNVWSIYEPVITRLPLQSFSESETRTYLARAGIEQEDLVRLILDLSGGLPLIVSMLAAQTPHQVRDLIEPSGSAVIRFLKWIDDSSLRALVVNAALPRYLNRDILRLLSPQDNLEAHFDWLVSMPFVEEHIGGWKYHSVVRELILRYKHSQSPEDWKLIHERLGLYHEDLRAKLADAAGGPTYDREWHLATSEVLFHQICANGRRLLPTAIDTFLEALEIDLDYADLAASAILQAGQALQSDLVVLLGKQLSEIISAYAQDRYWDAIGALSTLLEEYRNQIGHAAIIAAWRGNCYRLSNEFQKALDDLKLAVNLRPDYGWAITRRGLTQLILQDYKAALADFNEALRLDEQNALARVYRGFIYLKSNRVQDGQDDINKAIELDSDLQKFRLLVDAQLGRYSDLKTDLTAIFASRPQLSPVELLERISESHSNPYQELFLSSLTRNLPPAEELAYEEMAGLALAYPEKALYLLQASQALLASQFDQAILIYTYFIQESSSNALYWYIRGVAKWLKGEAASALQDIDEAIHLKPDFNDALVCKGAVSYHLGENIEAVKVLTVAIDRITSDALLVFALELRATIYLGSNELTAALEDCSRALKINPTYLDLLKLRSIVYYKLGQFEKALADLHVVVRLAPEDPIAHALRGDVYMKLKRYQRALGDLSQALALDRTFTLVLVDRAGAFHALGRNEEALIDATRAIESHPDNAMAYNNRAVVYSKLGRHSEAIQDFSRAVQIKSDLSQAFIGRASVFHEMDNELEALNDLNQAVENGIDNDDISLSDTFTLRADIHYHLGHYAEGLADLELALSQADNRPTHLARASNLRGLVLMSLGRYEEAKTEINNGLLRRPNDHTLLYNLAIATAKGTGIASAQTSIKKARIALEARTHHLGDRGSAFYGLGGLEAIAGNRNRALDYVRKAIPLQKAAKRWLVHDLAWQDLKNDPEIQQILAS